MTTRRCWVLLAAAAWTLYVWISRLVIMWGGDESGAFKAVHSVLAMVSIGFAVAIGYIALDWRRGRSRAPVDEEPVVRSPEDSPVG